MTFGRFFLMIVLALAIVLTGMAIAAEKVFFYHTDPACTPVANGNVVWRADYKPFGEEHTVTQTPENDMMFVGKKEEKYFVR